MLRSVPTRTIKSLIERVFKLYVFEIGPILLATASKYFGSDKFMSCRVSKNPSSIVKKIFLKMHVSEIRYFRKHRLWQITHFVLGNTCAQACGLRANRVKRSASLCKIRQISLQWALSVERFKRWNATSCDSFKTFRRLWCDASLIRGSHRFWFVIPWKSSGRPVPLCGYEVGLTISLPTFQIKWNMSGGDKKPYRHGWDACSKVLSCSRKTSIARSFTTSGIGPLNNHLSRVHFPSSCRVSKKTNMSCCPIFCVGIFLN